MRGIDHSLKKPQHTQVLRYKIMSHQVSDMGARRHSTPSKIFFLQALAALQSCVRATYAIVFCRLIKVTAGCELVVSTTAFIPSIYLKKMF